MKKFKLTPLPNSHINELTSNLSQIHLNNIELSFPVATIFFGHNLYGKYIKGYDLNGSLVFNVSLPTEIEEIIVLEQQLPIKVITLKW